MSAQAAVHESKEKGRCPDPFTDVKQYDTFKKQIIIFFAVIDIKYLSLYLYNLFFVYLQVGILSVILTNIPT
jgi:hypothetical protein